MTVASQGVEGSSLVRIRVPHGAQGTSHGGRRRASWWRCRLRGDIPAGTTYMGSPAAVVKTETFHS